MLLALCPPVLQVQELGHRVLVSAAVGNWYVLYKLQVTPCMQQTTICSFASLVLRQ